MLQITSNEEYEQLLAEAKRLWDAPQDTSEGDRLGDLITAIADYEDKHFPVEPPDPEERLHALEEHAILNQGESDILKSLLAAKCVGEAFDFPPDERENINKNLNDLITRAVALRSRPTR